MKRLITSVFLVLFVLSACDSPVGDFDSSKPKQQQTDHFESEIPPGTPREVADSLRQTAWHHFKNENGPEWLVTWNERTGIPRTIFSGTSKKVYKGTPEEAARSFLKEHTMLFGMKADLTDLKLNRVHTHDGITHVRFQQTHEGISVWEGDYLVHLGPDGKVKMTNGNYYPSIEVPTNPGIGEKAARQTTLDDLGGNVPLRGKIDTELVIYPAGQNDKFFLTWKVLIPANAPVGGDWQYFVDASNGSIIEKINLMTSVIGDGDIIEEHPGLTPNPVNRDFYLLDGSGYLRGDHADVRNDVSSRAYDSGNTFQYNITNTHFDEANMYWHLDRYRATFLETNLTFFGDFGSDGDEDIVAWVHDVTVDPNNAGWSPYSETLYFGNNFEFAKEDKVIYHEFTHGAVDVFHGGIDPLPNEEGAIDEGNADYFAGAFTGRTQIGEYCCPGSDRDMANPDISSYAQYNNQSPVPSHEGGEFWSAVLWDLHNNIDPYKANRLVFKALGYISSSPTFIEYRDAMLTVDDYNYGGSHNVDIMDTFANRGIGNPAPPINVSINGPGYISSYGAHQYEANVAWADGSVSYQWSIKWQGSSTWQNMGTNSTQTVYINNGNDFTIRVEVEDDVNSDTSTRNVIVTL